MKHLNLTGPRLRFGLMVAISTVCLGLADAQTAESATRKLVLEVINRHFTVGKKIPSVYLRVFSDGTAECHTERYWSEPDVVKQKKLPAQEYDALKTILENSDLLAVKHRYELMYWVVDSWIEWEIKVKHATSEQTFYVAGFSPSSASASGRPYPAVLTQLGCSIWQIRREVYEDKAGRPNDSEDCKNAIETP
jgi:hypothetical protein